jgi:hypothetical protein
MIETVQSETVTARDVARLVARGEPPEWLVFLFQSWVPTLALQRAMIGMIFTRSEARERMENIARAAKILVNALAHQPMRWLLEEPPYGAIPDVGGVLKALGDIERRANAAKSSPKIATADGTAPRGRGRATPSGTIEAKVLTAGMIAVAWKELHRRYPGPRNRAACEAAVALWRYSSAALPEPVHLENGVKRGEDPVTGWRDHFEAALAEKPVLGVNHDEFVRHMRTGKAREPQMRVDRGERSARARDLQRGT